MGLGASGGAGERPQRNTSTLSDYSDEGGASPEQQAMNQLKNTLGQFNDKTYQDIVVTYDHMQELLTQLDSIHTAIIQKHEADFISSYKEHMLKVQQELVQFKKKSSQYYQDIKKDETILDLQAKLKKITKNAVNIHGQIATHKENYKLLQAQFRHVQDEMYDW